MSVFAVSVYCCPGVAGAVGEHYSGSGLVWEYDLFAVSRTEVVAMGESCLELVCSGVQVSPGPGPGPAQGTDAEVYSRACRRC